MINEKSCEVSVGVIPNDLIVISESFKVFVVSMVYDNENIANLNRISLMMRIA